jgi:hypothetical protein
MLIPIPIGIKYVAAAHGTVWKFISCAYCRQPYAYLVELEAIGAGDDLLFLEGEAAKEQARANAQKNLSEKSRNVVVPVPCPACGCYQDDMARVLKEEVSINRFQIAGLVIGAISLAPLALSVPYMWVLTVVLAVLGLALLTWGYVLAFGFDANAGNPEARKALGRRYAVWGKQLSELLAANAPLEPDSAPARGGI